MSSGGFFWQSNMDNLLVPEIPMVEEVFEMIEALEYVRVLSEIACEECSSIALVEFRLSCPLCFQCEPNTVVGG